MHYKVVRFSSRKIELIHITATNGVPGALTGDPSAPVVRQTNGRGGMVSRARGTPGGGFTRQGHIEHSSPFTSLETSSVTTRPSAGGVVGDVTGRRYSRCAFKPAASTRPLAPEDEPPRFDLSNMPILQSAKLTHQHRFTFFRYTHRQGCVQLAVVGSTRGLSPL